MQRRRAAAYHAVMNLADRELPSPLYVSACGVFSVLFSAPARVKDGVQFCAPQSDMDMRLDLCVHMCHYYEVPSFYEPYRIWYFKKVALEGPSTSHEARVVAHDVCASSLVLFTPSPCLWNN